MNCLNQIVLEGNIVHMNSYETDTSIPVVDVSIAVERKYRNIDGSFGTEVSYFLVKGFGNVAQIIEKNGNRGCGIRVVGRLTQKRWTDDEGKERSMVYVMAEYIDFKPKVKKEVPDEG